MNPGLALAALLTAASPSDIGAPIRLGDLQARVWMGDRPSPSPRLVVVIHGDLASERDAYQYRFAEAAHQALHDTIVLALLRPGYADDQGARSPGSHGMATGDNYTPEVIAALHAAVLAARERYHVRSVTLVGHSGGAALAVDLAEADPALISRLLVASCPCDLNAWRAHMARRQMNPLWLMPVRSRSPMAALGRLAGQTIIRLVVGQNDVVTPPELTAAFVKAARGSGVQASAVVLPGATHTVLLDRRVLDQLVALQTQA